MRFNITYGVLTYGENLLFQKLLFVINDFNFEGVIISFSKYTFLSGYKHPVENSRIKKKKLEIK